MNNQLKNESKLWPMTYILILLSFIFFITLETAEASEEFTFDNPTLRGTGCKEGTTDVVMSPDSQTISILFDEFSVEVPQYDGDNDNDESDDPDLAPRRSNPNLDHKVCNIILAAKIPAGHRVEALDVSYDFRGYTFAEKGVRAVFSSVLMDHYGMGLRRRGKKGAHQLERKNWNGERAEVDDDWNMGSTHTIPVRSGCSVNGDNKITFTMKNKIAARIGKRFRDLQPAGGVTMDSADITGKMKFKMKLVPCRGNGNGNGHVRPRPDRPRKEPRNPRRRYDRGNRYGRAPRTPVCGRHMVFNPRSRRCEKVGQSRGWPYRRW